MVLWYFPIFLQAIVMAIDELYFHRNRGLPTWEKIGHPIDTFSVFICYGILCIQEPSELALKIYISACLFSCLLVTKDEFVHTEKCGPLENWLHALLFILHPITFFCAGYIWFWHFNPLFLKIQLMVLFIVMLYQVLYWRIFAKNK